MSKFFAFTRRKDVVKKDEKGQPISLVEIITNPDGTTQEVAIPGKFQTEEKSFIDYFSLAAVVRVHTLDNGNVVVLLNDGHEETQKTPTLKNPNKKGPISKNDIIEQKERVWIQSEILIEKNEVNKLFDALDNY